MNMQERDSILTELQTDMRWVKNQLSNHLHFHSRLNVALVIVALTTIGTLVLTLLRECVAI